MFKSDKQENARTGQSMDFRDELAIERTQLALENIHLGWIRILFNIMSAGLALDKGLEALHNSQLLKGKVMLGNGHILGIFLILLGSVLLSIKTFYYVVHARQLAAIKDRGPSLISLNIILSVALILVGFTVSFLLIVYG
jgi:uncharacterized membrane protein YidH (DUF202 family)